MEASLSIFTDKEAEILDRFSSLAWGHSEHFLKRSVFPEVGVIEYIDLGEYFSAIQLLFEGNLHHPTILVRNEYHSALDALKGELYYDGAYILGQPGIGKTLFLVYLIVHFLGQRNAVVLQISYPEPCYAFFTEKGIVVQSFYSFRLVFSHPSFIWALSDSNQRTLIPRTEFSLRKDRMRLVHATSPKTSRWKEWSKQVRARRFTMDVWSTEEIKKLAVLLRLDVERMSRLADSWGGVPRTLLQYYLEPDGVAERHFRLMVPHAVQECRMMLQKGSECDLPDNAPSSFYFIRPTSLTPKGRVEPPSVSVPTRTLRHFLAEGLQKSDEAVALQFFIALSGNPWTRQSAGYIFESWFHSFFSSEDKEIECKWLVSDSQDGSTQNLKSTTTLVSATQDAPSSWMPPLYWVPRESNFPGIDSAIISGNEIIAIQVTIAETHSSPPKPGLTELRDLLPDNLKNLSWKLLFVGINHKNLRKIARKYSGKIKFPTEEMCVPVGWSVVNPVQEQVIYRHFRDESDLAPEEPMDGELMEVEQ